MNTILIIIYTQILDMSRGFIDTSNNSQGLQRMLYDSFDEFETTPTMKRSLSFVDTTQHITDKTTWFEQNSSINNDNSNYFYLEYINILSLFILYYTIFE